MASTSRHLTDLERQSRIIRENPICAEAEQTLHVFFPVHRVDKHLAAAAVGVLQQARSQVFIIEMQALVRQQSADPGAGQSAIAPIQAKQAGSSTGRWG